MALSPLAWLPKGAMTLVKEVARHLLRRPVVGIVAAARTADGRWVLVRRADTGGWALPGGTLEWGEELRSAIARELLEEAGIEHAELERVAGVYSAPHRDPRFHAVTILVNMRVAEPTRDPQNPLEIREVRLFEDAELPSELSMSMSDLVDAARRDGPAVLE